MYAKSTYHPCLLPVCPLQLRIQGSNMGLKRDKLSSVLGTGDAAKGHIRRQYISITFEDLPVLEKEKSNTFDYPYNRAVPAYRRQL